ncbi:MAG: dienelactone hydrolase family protein [bacterium]
MGELSQRVTSGALVAALLVLPCAVHGQELKFPDKVTTLGFFSPLKMAIYKPNGKGPFPAVVLAHTCGGLSQHIRNWSKEALRRGYVVFVVDSVGPGGGEGCLSVSVYPGLRDVLGSLEHLSKVDVVDVERVAILGFSWGGIVALLASSPLAAASYSMETRRFAAAVAFYPECVDRGGDAYLRPDVDRPLLVLMAEWDNETPPADCIPRLERLKERGAPVEWHVYPEATHAWDKAENDGHSKQHWRGRVTYRYSKAATEDSVKRAFDFLAKHLSRTQ